MRGGKIVTIGKTAEVLASLTEDEREVMGKPQSAPAG
jgi:methyl coenzyme M reductase system subunit A2